jgi:hypothetical protein
MKKVALTVAVLALGLAACETKTENAVENVPVENAVEEDVNAAVDNGLDANMTADANATVDANATADANAADTNAQ